MSGITLSDVRHQHQWLKSCVLGLELPVGLDAFLIWRISLHGLALGKAGEGTHALSQEHRRA